MRYSPNLAIIIKALDKISGRLARDFGEIENLQNNHFSATKFANSCYKKIKENLVEDLMKIHPDYNIEFTHGEKIAANEKAEYNYVINPIDGMVNLSRSIPAFTTVIALEYKKEIIATAISNVAGNELYWCEKGSGAFMNNRRIRVSNRAESDNVLATICRKDLLNDTKISKNKFDFRLSNCFSLDIGYLASGRVDLCLFDESDEQILKPILLLLKEAGGSVSSKNGLIIASNGKVKI